MKCPKCGSDLTSSNMGTRGYGCEDDDNCGFYMTSPVFDRVVKNLYQTEKGYKPKFGDDTDNLKLLNSLNNSEVPDEYQDDVFLEAEDS